MSTDGAISVMELRRYRLRRGARERMIHLFDREFVETQEAEGMAVLGQFRDLDNADSFVWLRGFPDMTGRAASLERFYSGPVWRAHREAARETMVNTENVLLLRPAQAGLPVTLPLASRPAEADTICPPGLIVCTIAYLAPDRDEAFGAFFDADLRPALEDTGAEVIGSYIRERGENTYPRLPVREGETIFVWLARFAGLPEYEQHLALLDLSDDWRTRVAPEMDRLTWRPNEVARLTPTSRSRLHG